MVQFRRGGWGRQEGATRLCLHVRQRRLEEDSRLPREVDARGDGRGAGRMSISSCALLTKGLLILYNASNDGG